MGFKNAYKLLHVGSYQLLSRLGKMCLYQSLLIPAETNPYMFKSPWSMVVLRNKQMYFLAFGLLTHRCTSRKTVKTTE